MSKISALTIVLNEEANIERCIRSLQGVADEIIVLDTGCTDNTVAICRSLGVEPIAVPWEGYAATRNKGHQMAANPYILVLDADEALSEELRNSILQVKQNLTGAYRFNRLNYFYGQAIKHGGLYPDRKVRLFHRDRARWEGAHVHETLETDKGEAITQLQGDLLHYTVTDISDHAKRMDSYASLGAEALFLRGKKASVLKLLISPLWRFKQHYFFKAGFLDGKAGLIVAAMLAYGVFLRYAKLWQLHKNEAK